MLNYYLFDNINSEAQNNMTNFLKGIVVGLGAIAPGLSGSVLLVIFGLYQKTIAAISTIFKNFVKNLKFLIPLGCGILLGVILFSKLVDFLLDNYEMQTRFAFFGFILGSIPLFYNEVKKKGFKPKYYALVAAAFALGILLFYFNSDLFPEVTNPNFLHSILLGIVVAASYVVPGIDSAAILSALGMYDIWVSSLADLNFAVLIPAAIGLFIGVLAVSFIITKLIEKCYTITFSIIFGFFLSIIPRVLNDSSAIGLNAKTIASFVIMAVSFVLSLLFGKLEKANDKSEESEAVTE